MGCLLSHRPRIQDQCAECSLLESDNEKVNSGISVEKG